jgi:hypothetical protein
VPASTEAPGVSTPAGIALERCGKRRTVVAVSVARELAGRCTALATM